MSFTVIKPIVVTAGMIATDVAEDDYAEIANTHAYIVSDRVISVALHKIYECILGYTSANPAIAPNLDPTHWLEVSPTNRWKLIDNRNSSRTAKANSFYYEITPAKVISAIYADNIVGASSVRIRVTDPAHGAIYDQTTSLLSAATQPSWWHWYFGTRYPRSWALATDLLPLPAAVTRIDWTGDATLACGNLVLGQANTFGSGIIRGATGGIQDFSQNVENKYGDLQLTEGAYIKRRTWTIVLANSELDAFEEFMTSIRATPCLFIGHNRYAFTRVFGICSKFSPVLAYQDHSVCEMEFRGLT